MDQCRYISRQNLIYIIDSKSFMRLVIQNSLLLRKLAGGIRFITSLTNWICYLWERYCDALRSRLHHERNDGVNVRGYHVH